MAHESRMVPSTSPSDPDHEITESERHEILFNTPIYVPTEAGTIDQYHIISRIGGGAYGEVYLAVDIITREITAVKRVALDIRDAGVPFNIANEMLYLDRLSHPNVIKSHRVVTSHEHVFTQAVENHKCTNPRPRVYGRRGLMSSGMRQGSVRSSRKLSARLYKHDAVEYQANTKLNAHEMMEKPSMDVEIDGAPAIYIILEYMDYDLNCLIRSHRKNCWMPMSMIKYIMFQLLRGLEYLDGNRVGHFDIKPNNILLDQRGHLRIGDFGLATSYDPSGKGQRSDRVFFTPATLWYRPPDLLLSSAETGYRIAHQVDVWSAGCILGEMLSGDPMFPGQNEVDMLKRIFYVCGSPSAHNFKDAFSRKTYPAQHTFMRKHYDMMSPQPNKINQLFREKAKRCYEREYEIKFERDRVKLDTFACTHSVLDLLSKLLALDPRERISARQALQHPFFSEADLDSDMLTMPQFADLLNRVAPCDAIPDTGGIKSHRSYRENFTDPTLTISTPSMATADRTTPYTRRQPSSSVYIQRTPKQNNGSKTPQGFLNSYRTPLVGHIVYEPGVSPGTPMKRRRGPSATVHMMGSGANRVGNVTRAAIAAGGDIQAHPPPKRRKFTDDDDDSN